MFRWNLNCGGNLYCGGRRFYDTECPKFSPNQTIK